MTDLSQVGLFPSRAQLDLGTSVMDTLSHHLLERDERHLLTLDVLLSPSFQEEKGLKNTFAVLFSYPVGVLTATTASSIN